MQGFCSIVALFAVVASSGVGSVRPHCPPGHDMGAMRGRPAAMVPAAMAHRLGMDLSGESHPGHPTSTNPNCTCAGACMDGRSPVVRSVAPTLAGPPAEARARSASAPMLPLLGSPTAYLRPLPNAPPLV